MQKKKRKVTHPKIVLIFLKVGIKRNPNFSTTVLSHPPPPPPFFWLVFERFMEFHCTPLYFKYMGMKDCVKYFVIVAPIVGAQGFCCLLMLPFPCEALLVVVSGFWALSFVCWFFQIGY